MMKAAIPYRPLWFWLILWILSGGVQLYCTSYQIYQNYLFAYCSQPTTATIDRKFQKLSHDRHGTHHRPCFDYHYQVSSLVVHCELIVERATYESVTLGGSVPILYLPEKPTRNRINLPAENRDIDYMTYFLVGGSLLVLIGGGLLLSHFRRQNRLNRFLHSNGISCQGTVTEVKFNLVGKARTKRYYLTFTFSDNLGRERTGKTWYLKKGDESYWAEGAPIPVYYDPANSERFTADLSRLPNS